MFSFKFIYFKEGQHSPIECNELKPFFLVEIKTVKGYNVMNSVIDASLSAYDFFFSRTDSLSMSMLNIFKFSRLFLKHFIKLRNFIHNLLNLKTFFFLEILMRK